MYKEELEWEPEPAVTAVVVLPNNNAPSGVCVGQTPPPKSLIHMLVVGLMGRLSLVSSQSDFC
jgi:hypothetical protein